VSSSIKSTNFNMAIQRALGAEPIAGRPFPYNRDYRRALRKHLKVDVARVVPFFLASELSSYVNGSNIVVDCGRTVITQGCYED